MANTYKIAGKYFCGNEISAYGQEHNRLDYATFAKAFDTVLNNNIFGMGWDIGNGWELINGFEEDEEGLIELDPAEVFQWFIVSDNGAQMIQDYTNEILYYHEDLGIYLWGVTHYGTSWDYVLMDIPCNCGYEE